MGTQIPTKQQRIPTLQQQRIPTLQELAFRTILILVT